MIEFYAGAFGHSHHRTLVAIKGMNMRTLNAMTVVSLFALGVTRLGQSRPVAVYSTQQLVKPRINFFTIIIPGTLIYGRDAQRYR